MSRNLRVGEMRITVEGIAMARGLFSGTDEGIAERLDGIRSTLGELDRPDTLSTMGVVVDELDPQNGYALWAANYDTMSNALLDIEEPVVRRLVGPGPLGDVLDACTGTGRHLSWLAQQATSVTGLDQSPEMLRTARAKVPSASFMAGDLLGDHHGDLPDSSFDLVVCALALTHFPSLDAPMAELVRLVRPGGRVVLSDTHPLMNLLDGQAFFPHEDGRTPFVRNYPHLHGDYLRAFARAGLSVLQCEETLITEGKGPLADGILMMVAPKAARAAYLGLPMVLAWELGKPK